MTAQPTGAHRPDPNPPNAATLAVQTRVRAIRDHAQHLYDADRMPTAAHVRARALWIAAIDAADVHDDHEHAHRLADEAAAIANRYHHTR